MGHIYQDGVLDNLQRVFDAAEIKAPFVICIDELEFLAPNPNAEGEENYNAGTIVMVVLAKGKELKEWEDIRLNFVATHFRYETLRRIVEEFYMCSGACHNDTWGDDVDGFIRDKCADWFDSYDSAMA